MKEAHSIAAPRFIALWIPHWPLTSLVVEAPPDAPAAVVHRARVQVMTPAARRRGVQVGMTQIMAQYLCPNLLIFPQDEQRDSAAFEVILEVFDSLAAGVVALRPGVACAPVRGAARWAGGEDALARELGEQIAIRTGAECQIGIATTLVGALVAARQSRIVPSVDTGRFLDAQKLTDLTADLPDSSRMSLAEDLHILHALGVTTAGDLRALGEQAVMTRFGASGQMLWQIVQGRDPLRQTHARATGAVQADVELDPPCQYADHALTAIRHVANDLADQLVQRGLYADTVRVTLERVGGQVHERTWTLLDATSSLQVGKRVTWQVRGMTDIAMGEADTDQYALRLIRLTALYPHITPENEVLWGSGQNRRRAGRAVEEVQALLGEDAAVFPTIHGGCDPRTRVTFVPWGFSPRQLPSMQGEWEGAVSTLPIVLFGSPPSALLMGDREDGTIGPIWVDRRGNLNGTPRHLIVHHDHMELSAGDYPLTHVAAIWVIRGRWWQTDQPAHAPRCYLQVARTEGTDLLLVQRSAAWWVEGVYPHVVQRVAR